MEELCSKSQELRTCLGKTTTLKEENALFSEELLPLKKSKDEFLTMSNENSKKCLDSMETVDSESASKNKDQQDEIEVILSSLEALEDELSSKSCELGQAIANSQMLETTQLQGKTDVISTLELGLSEERESVKLLSSENLELRAHMEDAMAARYSVEKELIERQKISERMKMELLEMSNALEQMNP
ncbi:PREDICTED: kinesin [Prunus dulcis]|uniref:PREDICTED: kinesin n=1 Tax=Prunus dulcis TaxID=3755 RepID=A0A5E4EIG9_PRUDU|nr:PREDICTED: kinesin [Prunus dulcis]